MILRRSDARFLILLPITRPPDLLEFAVSSIQQQTEEDYEVHIISDGAPEETNCEIARLRDRDSRLTAHLFPKGKRNGEYYRDPIIRESRARYVCQIADDDIWFPDHLREIGKLLAGCDFGHTIQTEAAPGFKLMPRIGDIADPAIAQRMLNERFNIFGPTACGYTRSAYLQLETGWEAAPEEVWSDLFMWRKFLAHEGISRRSRFAFTNLHIAGPLRRALSLSERHAENSAWFKIVSDERKLDALKQCLFKHVAGRPQPGAWVSFNPNVA
jgi:glycosyltransferase involved in cell wall biosynthesis